jgi:succinylglutamate desuccinylase
MANTTEQAFTDINSACFQQAFALFKTQGDFLKITRDFEHHFENSFENSFEPNVKHSLTPDINTVSLTQQCQALRFSVNNATVSLIDSGVLLIEPNELADSCTQKNVIISSGIHGNETAPIEIVQQLVSDFITEKAQIKQRTLFIIGNPVSMNLSKRFEIENLNRLFCGKYQLIDNCYEKERAKRLESYVENFFTQQLKATNYHYDLHTAIRPSKHEKFAIYPYQGDKPCNKEQLSFMHHCGVSTILFGHGPTGTFSYFSSANFNAHSFTIELGKVKAFGENDMANFSAMSSGLSALISQVEYRIPEFDSNNVTLFKALGDITKETDDFILYVADNVLNFTDYPVGTLLAVDSGREYRTTKTGESIIFPNANVGHGQRAALMVVPTTLD